VGAKLMGDINGGQVVDWYLIPTYNVVYEIMHHIVMQYFI
jgi:hypothetical protein